MQIRIQISRKCNGMFLVSRPNPLKKSLKFIRNFMSNYLIAGRQTNKPRHTDNVLSGASNVDITYTGCGGHVTADEQHDQRPPAAQAR